MSGVEKSVTFFSQPYNDGLVKSLKRRFSVIPAQAGIQYFHVVRILWIPVFTGMMTFYDSIKSGENKNLTHGFHAGFRL